MTAKILVIDIERQSALLDGIWEGRQYKNWIGPERVIEPSRTICFAYRWVHENRTKFVSEWDDELRQNNRSQTPGGGHLLMTEKARDLFDEADYVVGWNSKKFDVKHLRAMFYAYSLTPPSPHVDIDLMLQANREFLLPAKSMAFVSFLKGMDGKDLVDQRGIGRTLRYGTKREIRDARRALKKYNIRDVDQTLELYQDMLPWIKGMNLGLYTDSEEPSCSNCESPDIHYRGYVTGLSYRYRRFQCQNCGKWGKDTRSESKVEVVGI